jgi:plastocyanin
MTEEPGVDFPLPVMRQQSSPRGSVKAIRICAMKSSSKLRRIAQLSLLVLLTSCPVPRAVAADYYVSMSFYDFNPSYLEIQVGDTVWWRNDDFMEIYSSVSTQGYWNTGEIYPDEIVGVPFPFVGDFPYQDPVYAMLGMKGRIVVKPATPQTTPGLLVDPARLPNGSFQFTVTNLVVGQTCIIQTSTNLVDWDGIYTNLVSASSFTFTDNAAAAAGQRFYRAWHLP